MKDKFQKYYFNSFKIYATYLSLSLLNNKNIKIYFVDTIYKCVSFDIEDTKALLVLMGYNTANDLFEPVLVSLLSKEDAQVFIDLYSF